MKNNTKTILWMSLIMLALIFILVYGLNHILKDEIQKIVESEIKELKEQQRKILENDEKRTLKIDSIHLELTRLESIKTERIERYYHTKEIIKQKFENDEKYINNLNLDIDTIRKYFSEYKYQPYIRTGN